MLHSQHKSIDSDDEDYELPSLSERIQAAFKPRHNVQHNITSDSENEETEFLKFSEQIRNTPRHEIKMQHNKTSNNENEESDVLKFSERIQNTPCSQVKLKLNLSSDSESEESEFLKFSEKIRNTPRSEFGKYDHAASESDSDETFSNLVQKIREIQTPKSQTREHHEVNVSDSDEVFSNVAAKIQEIRTPRSQNRCYTEASNSFLLPDVTEKRRLLDSRVVLSNKENLASSEGASNSLTVFPSKNEREYASLFPSKSDNSKFQNNKKYYTETLFEFFNRKIFNYKLPKDIPLIWDHSLVTTAGLTNCSAKGGVYSCSIKLSSKLLTSFDRLQDTLLHEMCHAATWIINKKNVHHGPLWQIWASRCKLILPFVECPARCHNYDVHYRFWYRCTNCNWKKGTCKQVRKYQAAVCKKCKIPIIMTVNK